MTSSADIANVCISHNEMPIKDGKVTYNKWSVKCCCWTKKVTFLERNFGFSYQGHTHSTSWSKRKSHGQRRTTIVSNRSERHFSEEELSERQAPWQNLLSQICHAGLPMSPGKIWSMWKSNYVSLQETRISKWYQKDDKTHDGKSTLLSQEQWHMPVILAQGKLALEDQEPKALYYKVSSTIVLDGKHRKTLSQNKTKTTENHKWSKCRQCQYSA